MDTLQTLTYSSIASLIARTVFYPLDTIKTRIQHAKSYKVSSWNPFKLYQGLRVTLLFSVPASAVYLTTYDTVKNHQNNESVGAHTIAAISAEGLAGVLFTPMEVMKQKLQVVESRKNTLAVLQETWMKYGIRGFYKGYFLGQAVFIPYTVTYFVTYERLKMAWKERFSTSDLQMYFQCSLLSGALAGAISNPLDVIKTRVQIASNKSVGRVTQDLYQQHKWSGFFKGMGARIVWIAPSMSLSITLFELLKDYNKM